MMAEDLTMAIMDSVLKVMLIHAEKAVTDPMRAVIVGLEEELKSIDERVIFKNRLKDRDVAKEIVEMIRKLEGDGVQTKAVIYLSPRLCEVMKNNKELSQTFQNFILNDQDTAKKGERRLALLWDKDLTMSSPIFSEAFSTMFIDHFTRNSCGVKCREDPNDMKLPSFVKAIAKQWIGPTETAPETASAGLPMADDNALDIETVHIVHGGGKEAKQAVREISRELEDGFQLVDCTKYKLYNRVQECQIPDIVMSEIQTIIDNNGPNTLGVIMWCPRLLNIMREPLYKDHFEALILRASVMRVVHMCLGTLKYEIGRYFNKIPVADLRFITLDYHEDRTIDTTDLIKIVRIALDQCRGNPAGEHQSFNSTEANPPSETRFPSSNDDRKMSEPNNLSSQDEGRRPAPLMRVNPLSGQSSSVNLIGNPSNQNKQGARVVPSNFSSHSEDSAGYTSGRKSTPGRNQSVHAQPSSGGSSGNKDWKYVGNNGGSWSGNLLPRESVDLWANVGRIPMGEYPKQDRPPFSPSQSDASQNRQEPMDGSPASKGNASGVYHQATPSESSADTDKLLANGDNSMPMTSIHSQPFGSVEPVLPTSDATVECSSGGLSGPHGNYHAVGPNNCSATAAQNGHHAAGDIPPNIRPAPYDDGMQRPTGNKIPRRDGSEDIFMAGPGGVHPGSLPQDHFSRITPSVDSSSPSERACSSFASLQMTPHHPNSSNVGPASLPSTTSLNMPASSAQQSAAAYGSYEKPFVQVTADDPHDNHSLRSLAYATNLPSKNAFQQEDYREGCGQNLPANAIGSEFRSLPSAGQRLRNMGAVNGDERVHTTPPRINSANRNPAFPMDSPNEPSPPELPPEQTPIIEMDYRCREMLKIMLDPDTNTGNNWEVFAYYFKMKFEEVNYAKSLMRNSAKSATLHLLNWLHQKHPEITCGDFKEVAEKHQRLDVVRKMKKFKY